MKADEMTFGVEIECYIPEAHAPMAGGYHNGLQVPGLPAGWTAQRDSSLNHSPAPGLKGVEIVSPVLKGADGLRQVQFVCEWLARVGARVNRTCGFHCHVGFDATKAAELTRVVALVARHEKALFAVTGTRSRERADGYSKPIKDSPAYVDKFRNGNADRGIHDRYVTLNLTNLLYGTKPTVEFRVFSGTTSATKAIMNVQLCLGIVEKAFAMKRPSRWDIAHKPLTRKGEGANALKHLTCELGWEGTYAGTTYGAVAADGLPALADCLAEARRLAAKYDAGSDD